MATIKDTLAKIIFGHYPPQNCINYIWANRNDATERVFSPFTDRAVMIPLQSGPEKVGRWVEEKVNALADYRRAFGGEPPGVASLAVMSDADNTGEGATAYLDYIKVGN